MRDFKDRLEKVKSSEDWSAGWVSSKRIKAAAIKVHGHQCSMCKRKKWLKEPIPLVMDHMDGNSDNWSFKNIRLVCGNCDMMLPTYKSKNKGNGRHYRRERRRQGKSF